MSAYAKLTLVVLVIEEDAAKTAGLAPVLDHEVLIGPLHKGGEHRH